MALAVASSKHNYHLEPQHTSVAWLLNFESSGPEYHLVVPFLLFPVLPKSTWQTIKPECMSPFDECENYARNIDMNDGVEV
eukprot:4959203-Amphidinium_carterae.1